MDANWNISYGAKYGQWALLPVTDIKFVEQRPSEQLGEDQRQRRRTVLWRNITTDDDFVDFVHYLFSQFTDEQFEAVLAQYPILADVPTVRFATDGLNKDTIANFVGTFAVGHQQRANNLYAETTFHCPAYWMAEGFSMNGHQSYKYQFPIINSLYGEDETVYLNTFGPVDYLASSFRDSSISMLDGYFTTGTKPLQLLLIRRAC